MLKQFVADYLAFSKKERTGIIVLLSLIGFLLVLPIFFPLFIRPKQYPVSSLTKEIASLKMSREDSPGEWNSKENYSYRRNDATSANTYDYKELSTKGELFYFDPNTASIEEWVRLGVKEKTATTIRKYISKGGSFRKPEDLGKIWGLKPEQVERMLPFVQIAAAPATNHFTKQSFEERKPFEKRSYTPTVIDINVADTTALIALPGIGSKLSQRIIAFRDKLGGFYKPEQVGETFGLPDSVFQKIKDRLQLNASTLRKININTATIDEMKSHPYLRYQLANAIVQYRTQHGNYASVADLKKIMLISDAVFDKVYPYLETGR